MRKVLIGILAVWVGMAFACGAWAGNVKIGGRMLTDIGWWSRSNELSSSGDDVGTVFIDVPAHTYLRAVFTSADKTTGGKIELGLKSLHASATASLRYAYGWWKVGSCKLIAGQTDNWFGSLMFAPKQFVGLGHNAHLLLMGWGFLWPHRVPQVNLTWTSGAFGVQLALEEPRSSAQNYWAGQSYDAEYKLPRISLTLRYKAGDFITMPGISYMHKYAKGLASGSEDNYKVWAFVLPIKFTTGPLTVKFQGHYGQNFRAEFPFYPSYAVAVLVNNKVKDTTCWGGAFSVEYILGPLTLTSGAGYEKFENSDWKNAGYTKDSTSRWGCFVAASYKLTDNFRLHPELAYYSYGDDPDTGADQGTEWIVGMQLCFAF